MAKLIGWPNTIVSDMGANLNQLIINIAVASSFSPNDGDKRVALMSLNCFCTSEDLIFHITYSTTRIVCGVLLIKKKRSLFLKWTLNNTNHPE